MIRENQLLIKYLTLVLLGVSHVIMQEIIPVGGGGINLVFVITIPVLIMLSGIFAVIVYWIDKKNIETLQQHFWFVFFVFILSLITFGIFPYA
jgi:energy-coupling factor transporter transmembrane protein EcfT